MRSLFLVLAGLAWLSSPVFAQTTGGGSTGGGGQTGGSTAARGGTGTSSSGTGNFGPTGGLGFGSGASGVGAGGGAGARGAAGATTYPTQANPFRSYFANPMGVGMSGTNSAATNVPKAAFGQPLFGALAATATTLADQAAGVGSTGFSTIGLSKGPAYVTTLSDDVPLIQHPPAKIERDLRDVLLRSTTLKAKNNVALSVDGQAVILRGQVGSERERRLAESLIRLTPGVYDVRNELTVGP